MTAPVVLSAEEHDTLVQKARAWDDHVMRRMMEGFVRAEQDLTLISKHNAQVEIELTDQIIITPFGTSRVRMYDDNCRRILLNPGDHVRLNSEVQLKIS